MKLDRSWATMGIMVLLLSLAPFTPEPHLYGKIKWIIGGAVGMQTMDWFDFLFHGGPILVYLIVTGYLVGKKIQSNR